jgi:hypothetical protein
MPKISPDPVQTELPVTPAVEQPILNSPYYEPGEHWVYGKDGKASRMPGRRPATYFWTTQRTGSEQLQMEGSYCVRNDHMGFPIPYEYMGVSHALYPDFIVKLKNGVSLIPEVKGQVDDREKAKFEAAKRWCSAVNNWGKMGTWQFHPAKDPDHLLKELSFLNGKEH